MITRMQLMKVHTVLAAFIFPVAIMFMITGALYTWGVKGSYSNEIYSIPYGQELKPELASLKAFTERELDKLQLDYPTGKSKIKDKTDGFIFEWSGSSKDITLESTNEASIAKLTVEHATWYRNLVQLHKAKGGVVFKVYGTFFALAMGFILFSGFMMAWQAPKLKRITIGAFVAGIGSFLIMVLLS